MSKKAILVVSFGSSYLETREKTIDVIEKEMAEAFPKFSIYSAYTSKIILKILKERDKLNVNSVVEVFEKMYQDGIEEVYVQPTLVLNGIEYNIVVQEIESFKNRFKKIEFGSPLLTSTEDYLAVIDAFLADAPKLKEREAIVLMGHGSKHFSNSAYAALDYMFKAGGNHDIHVATVEAFPYLEDITGTLKANNYDKIFLIPFMIVAGEHAKKDMASSKDDSWKIILEKMGFEVECILKGLGENSKIRNMFIEHVGIILK
ncbi:MAG: sirohydrochlorin cobaltochelatase [Bacilli bacterium]